MNWIYNLFFTEGVAHSVLLFAIVIAIGIPLGRIKIFGVSLGITLVLFVGILIGQLGFSINPEILHFIKEFGLILFVFTIGLQVGPGFFASFKQGGMLMNGLAAGIVLLGVGLTIAFHYITGIPMPTMAGILSGAVTNTPGLGAAQQAFAEISSHGVTGSNSDPALLGTLGQGYACAYPLGVVGIILAIILIRVFFKISYGEEAKDLAETNPTSGDNSVALTVHVCNPAVVDKSIAEIKKLFKRKFVISRFRRGDQPATIPNDETELKEGDHLLIISAKEDSETISTFFGKVTDWNIDDWDNIKSEIVRRRVLVTRAAVNGRPLGRLDVYKSMGVIFTRINRAGVVLIATPTLRLQIGDRVNVVGPEHAINEVEKFLGNELKELDHPNLVSIFLGIAVGVIFGSIPFMIPGISQPVKLGLAGGPLIVAILLSCWGYKSHLITYTPIAANLMIREIGILLFLASVGIGAGKGFLQQVLSGGYWWVLIGFVITIVPLLVIGLIARGVFKLNYFSIMGLISGSMTDPPALAYANSFAKNGAPSVAYATVYPLSMFLRVLTAQLLIVLFCS